MLGSPTISSRADTLFASSELCRSHPAAGMRLNGIVDDLDRHCRGLYLDHGDFLLRRLVADLVHHVGGLEAQEPGHLDIDASARHAFLPYRMLVDRLAESLPLLQPAAHLGQRLFGDADGAHAVVDAARPEAALRDLEAAPFAQQQDRKSPRLNSRP